MCYILGTEGIPILSVVKPGRFHLVPGQYVAHTEPPCQQGTYLKLGGKLNLNLENLTILLLRHFAQSV